MSGRQVLVSVEVLERLLSPREVRRMWGGPGAPLDMEKQCRYCEFPHDAHAEGCPVPVLRAALTAPPLGVATPAMRGPDWNGATPFSEPRTVLLTTPPTIPDSALSGMASIPDKPEPEQEALAALARSWKEEAILLYAQGTSIKRDGSATWHDSKCCAEHDTLQRCAAALLALHKVPRAD